MALDNILIDTYLSAENGIKSSPYHAAVVLLILNTFSTESKQALVVILSKAKLRFFPPF